MHRTKILFHSNYLFNALSLKQKIPGLYVCVVLLLLFFRRGEGGGEYNEVCMGGGGGGGERMESRLCRV